MTDFEKALQLKEKLITLVGLSIDEELIDDNYYKNERKYFIDHYPQKIPDFIKKCRNLNDFTNTLRNVDTGTGSWHSRRMFIDSEFTNFLDFLEFGENLPSEKIELKSNLEIENSLNIILEKDLFEHIKEFLKVENYYHSIEESYKFVREELRKITGEEVAHKAFGEKNYTLIFGKSIGETQAEKDFFEGIKYLNFAVQYLRNEKVHLLANNKKIDKNLAFQYIILANLAYKLIKK